MFQKPTTHVLKKMLSYTHKGLVFHTQVTTTTKNTQQTMCFFTKNLQNQKKYHPLTGGIHTQRITMNNISTNIHQFKSKNP